MAHGSDLHEGDEAGNVHLVFIRWAEESGPLYFFTILHKVFIVANSPKLAKDILMDTQFQKPLAIYKRTQYISSIRFMGNGLISNTNHNDWKCKRHAINPAFYVSTLEKYAQVFNDAADRLIKEVELVADTGQLVSILSLFHRTTLDVIGQAAFSEDILNTSDGDFTEAIYISLKYTTSCFRNPLFQWLPWNRGFINKAEKQALYIREKAQQMVTNRIEDIENNVSTPDDILDLLIRSLADRYPLDDLVDEVITMFVAGQETTANLISFFFLEMGRHHSMQDIVRNEIDHVVGAKRFISQNDVTKLIWTTSSINETLRLYPPSIGTMRISPNQESQLEDFRIPRNSFLLVNFFSIHYLHHKDGFNFNPERFIPKFDSRAAKEGLDAEDPDITPLMFSHVPFSIGHRSCIGRNFAYLETKILLAKFFQHFTFKLNPAESFRVENSGTFRPVDGAKLFVYKR